MKTQNDIIAEIDAMFEDLEDRLVPESLAGFLE